MDYSPPPDYSRHYSAYTPAVSSGSPQTVWLMTLKINACHNPKKFVSQLWALPPQLGYSSRIQCDCGWSLLRVGAPSKAAGQRLRLALTRRHSAKPSFSIKYFNWGKVANLSDLHRLRQIDAKSHLLDSFHDFVCNRAMRKISFSSGLSNSVSVSTTGGPQSYRTRTHPADRPTDCCWDLGHVLH